MLRNKLSDMETGGEGGRGSQVGEMNQSALVTICIMIHASSVVPIKT